MTLKMKQQFFNVVAFFSLQLCFSVTLDTVKDSIQLNPSIQDSIAKYRKLSTSAYGKGDLESFKKYADIVLDLAKNNKLTELQIRSLVHQAIYYQQTDQYNESLITYLEAEELNKSIPETSSLQILVSVNLGNLYIAIGDYEMANNTMRKVLELAKHQDDPNQVLTVAYSILGTAALNQKNFPEALEYMYKSKDLAIKMGRNDYIVRMFINIADCQRQLGKYNEAILNANEALSRITNEGSVESIALAKFSKAVAYYELKEALKALPLLNEVKEIAENGNFLKIKMETHQYLAKIYESINNIKNSLEEQKEYTKTREKYLNTLSKVQRLKIEKESELKSETIDQQKKSIVFLAKEKQLYLLIGLVLALVLIISTIIFRIRKKKLLKNSQQLRANKILLENENETLKDKLNTFSKQILEQQNSNKKPRTVKKKSSLTEDERIKYTELILNYMEKEKPYLNPEIERSTVADDLGITINYFSEVLNICFEKNFNNFINLYRLDKAKQLMRDPKFKDYKILAIGYEAGFPSKSSFNRIFKNLVGLTPSEYQKKHNPTA